MPWQWEFHRCKAKRRIVCNGRQTGKTTAAIHELMKHAASTPNGVFMWVDYENDLSSRSLDILEIEYPPPVQRELKMRIVRAPQKNVTLGNGARIFFRTGKNERGLVGSTLDGLMVNEAGLIENPKVWHQALEPALAVRNGWAVFVGTPRSRNWFYNLFVEGQQGCKHWHPDWEERDHSCKGGSHFIHTFWNPTSVETSKADANFIKRKTKEITSLEFRMEYLAEFVEEQASVFSNFRGCLGGELEPPREGASYVIGVDLAKHGDYTVIIVMDRRRNQVVHFSRFHSPSWPVVEQRVMGVYKRYNHGKVVIDGTGVGDPVCANLRKHIRRMEVVNMGHVSRKVELIENLISVIEHEEVQFPEIPELIEELNSFNYEILPSGSVRYSGIEGKHDDCVVALALVCWPMRLSKRAVKQLDPRTIRMVKSSMRL